MPIPKAVKAVFTVDIVDFSLSSQDEQMSMIKTLIDLLRETVTEAIPEGPSAWIWSPAGDGGSITFWNDISPATETAILLGKLLKQHNDGLPRGAKPLQVRMGLHTGIVTKENDVDDRENVWGDGINMSARVATVAKPDQILASEDFYKAAGLDTWPASQVRCIGTWWVKHNKALKLYNICKDGVGIPNTEVEEWYGPFHYPLQLAINIYEAMVEEEAKVTRNAFRAAVLAKRLLDLKPQHSRAREIIESISERRFRVTEGERYLFHAFFSKLSPNALLHFFQNAVFKEFDKEEIIYREGIKADSMMMVVSGEIELYIGQQHIILREGAIIGEMGLFNPGETRTATLKATAKTITLDLDYNLLKIVEGVPDEENKTRREIQDQIWQSYCRRTIENQVYAHSLFKKLSSAERSRLLDSAEFLPSHYDKTVQLDIHTLWDHWCIVVAGSIMVRPIDSQKEVELGKGDCLGPIRLIMRERPSYSAIQVSPDTQIVRFPWKIIEELINASEQFEDSCFSEARSARRRLGLTY